MYARADSPAKAPPDRGSAPRLSLLRMTLDLNVSCQKPLALRTLPRTFQPSRNLGSALPSAPMSMLPVEVYTPFDLMKRTWSEVTLPECVTQEIDSTWLRASSLASERLVQPLLP